MIKNRLNLLFVISLLSHSMGVDLQNSYTNVTTEQSISESDYDQTGDPLATHKTTAGPQKSEWGWLWIPLAIVSVVLGVILIFVILCCRNKSEEDRA